MIKKSVNIRITSLITSYTDDITEENKSSHLNVSESMAENIYGVKNELNAGYGYKEEAEPEEITFGTDGILSEKGDCVEITYQESEKLGMTGITSTLRFKKSAPHLVNLIRKGAAPASLVFDASYQRSNCTYYVGGVAFDFCICTSSVKNTSNQDGGKIVLDYDIEIHGVKAEHNVYTLEYTYEKNV